MLWDHAPDPKRILSQRNNWRLREKGAVQQASSRGRQTASYFPLPQNTLLIGTVGGNDGSIRSRTQRSEPGHGDAPYGDGHRVPRRLLGQAQGSKAPHEPRSLIRVSHKRESGRLSVAPLGVGVGRRPDSTTETNLDQLELHFRINRSCESLKLMLLK